jgi:glycosyltransferase involved in cell wall biosynthesis
MKDNPRVSAIIIFLNAERFIEEAIESVFAQTYEQWELLLVDDGSTDGSTQIALDYASRFPQKVYFFEHLGHQNQGKSASRNLGMRHARGEYIAFLDADDVWLPYKLEQQIAILDSSPEAGMLYGDTLYWYSWTGKPEDARKDFVPKLGVETNRLIDPPSLLPLFLRGKAAVPCTCSLLVRRAVAEQVKGFDESYQCIKNIYEDQAFYAKVCLATPVIVLDTCWDRYRQHPDSGTALSKRTSQEEEARKYYLNWLEDYLAEQEIEDIDLLRAIRKEKWLIRHPLWLPESEWVRTYTRWLKKWVLRLEERLLPGLIRGLT